MLTASIKFLGNSLLADLTCKENELRNNLQSIGVLTVPSMITLDNARTLQIHITANDETGEVVLPLVNTNKDTLGSVQRLCRYIYCMNDYDKDIFIGMIESGEIKSVQQGLQLAQGLREQHTLEKCR